MARLFGRGRSEVQGNLRLHPIVLAVLLLAPFLLFQVSLGQAPVGSCGSLGGGAVCQDGYCCSTSGYCGTTSDYCGAGNCQSQCPPSSSPTPGPPTTPTPPTTPSPGSGVGSLVTSAIFDTIFPPAQRDPLYTYDGFITATNFYLAIGTTGDSTAQSREVAALLAHISHETGALSKIRETNPTANYCDQTSTQYPCAPNQQYYDCGPLQLSWNYNYGQAGAAIGQDLLNDPDLVATNSAVSFETAFWFWTTAQAPKPSCHDVMDGTWSPSSADVAANRQPGFGVTIMVINGGQECGSAP